MKLLIALPEGGITIILLLYFLMVLYIILSASKLNKAKLISISEFLLLILAVCLIPIIGPIVGWAIIKRIKK